MLYNWKCRRQLTQISNNILKDPSSFCLSALPFSDCCQLLFSSLSSQDQVVIAATTHHLLTQLLMRQKEMPFLTHNLFYQGEKIFPEVLRPKATSLHVLLARFVSLVHTNSKLIIGTGNGLSSLV